MELFAIISLCVNCVLIGLAAAIVILQKNDTKCRLQVMTDAAKLKAEFADNIATVAKFHNETAQRLMATEDKLQSLTVGLATQQSAQQAFVQGTRR